MVKKIPIEDRNAIAHNKSKLTENLFPSLSFGLILFFVHHFRLKLFFFGAPSLCSASNQSTTRSKPPNPSFHGTASEPIIARFHVLGQSRRGVVWRGSETLFQSRSIHLARVIQLIQNGNLLPSSR